MFNAKQKKYGVYTATVTVDSYGEAIKTYALSKTIEMFISLASHEVYTAENTLITQCTHTGITKAALNKGDLIDMKYEVLFVEKTFNDNIVYLKEVESDGQ